MSRSPRRANERLGLLNKLRLRDELKEGRSPDCPGGLETAAPCYAPRLKRNRYSSNRTMAPTTDMIQPAT